MRKEDLILYNQMDERWRDHPYSANNDKYQTIGRTGSGPTASATVVASLKNKKITPLDTAQIALDYDDRTKMSGTAWPHFYHVANWFNFSKFVQSVNIEDLIDCIKKGGLVVCAMKGGIWFKVPNYIIVYDYDDENVFGAYLYGKNPYRKQLKSLFAANARRYFCFYP